MARTQTRRAWVIANRLTYIGELGWELHIPTEMAQHVFDVLWEAGGEHGLHPGRLSRPGAPPLRASIP
ncbi:hypothetical protein [Mesorhizobium waimense]|uniref:hypothetical protein n=1 Tax=Mesorhizobium waimense TaxID=1300307 RepID=UPI001FE2359F|nr:hypothetical protein [Mesorhizobium waimense]